MCQTNYNDLPIIRKEHQLAGVYSLNVMKDMENRIIHSRLTLHYITNKLTLLRNAAFYVIPMQYFIFYKSHGSNLFNFSMLSVLVAWPRNHNSNYSARSIFVKQDFFRAYILFSTITNRIHGCTAH